MNKIKKHISILCIAVFVLLSFPMSAFAETKTADLIELEADTNISVVIEYDVEIPTISFIAPDDTVWDTSNSNVTVVKGDMAVNYQIRNASAGQWKINYDKKSNSKLNYIVVPFTDNFWIDSFTAGAVDESYIPVSFKACYSSDVSYIYQIDAVTLDSNSNVLGTKYLANGYATSNEEYKTDVNISSLETYDKYYLMLTVTYDDPSGLKITDSKVSANPFSYTKNNSVDAMENFIVDVDLSTYTVYVDWTDFDIYADKYVAAIFSSDDETTPIGFAETSGDETYTSFLIDPDISNYTVKLSYIGYDGTSKACIKKFDLNSKTRTFDIVTPESTNSKQAEIKYTVDADVSVTVSVNGNETESTVAKGTSSIAVNLVDGNNDIIIRYLVANNVYFTKKKSIDVDSVAPVLTLYENLNHITTAQMSYTVVGEAEYGCTVKVNDKEIKTDANGAFTYKVQLSPGENIIKVEAVDKAGNITACYALVNQVSSVISFNDVSLKDFIVMIVSAAVTLILTVLYITLVKRKSSESSDKISVKFVKSIVIALGAFSAIDLSLLVWRIVERLQLQKLFNSMAYYNLVESSFDEAYSKIASYNNTLKEIIILSVVFVVLVLFIFFFSRLLKKLKTFEPKPKKKKPKQNRSQKSVAPTDENKPKPYKDITPTDEPPLNGYKEISQDKQEEKKSYFCPQCGQKYDSKPNFCGNCGYKTE